MGGHGAIAWTERREQENRASHVFVNASRTTAVAAGTTIGNYNTREIDALLGTLSDRLKNRYPKGRHYRHRKVNIFSFPTQD